MCAYIGFGCPGAVGADELLRMGKRSLNIAQNGNSVAGMDVLPHCGSASSATHKKILLQLSPRKISDPASRRSGGGARDRRSAGCADGGAG